jgi:hypothetical protein
MKQLQRTLTLLAMGLLAGGNAFAVNNGDFTVDLVGWDTLGDASVQGGAALLSNAYDAADDNGNSFNFSGTAAVDAPVLEAAAGLASGTLSSTGWDGSLLQQSFAVNAGDTLSFNWNFLSNEPGQNDIRPDFAFVVINGVLTQLGSVALATTQPGLNGFAAQTGWSTFSQTFASAGNVTLALGVVDVDDVTVSSALLVDQVTLAAVPEPGALVLLGAGLVFSGWSQRRRR